ncbi:glycosyltransferase [Hymenobacter aquaticus]|uniref:Glycosyltransferase n=1 Tax=Hymenobacter aquaticus TaxID=1867101 RepID=A0A4Z0Q5J5_9BACT|nr:glycosyltransferase family 4 protein [Hymenobacter aquaticus]TGE25350.1 glycosyltransferase [Hymenobacter aquaticus]
MTHSVVTATAAASPLRIAFVSSCSGEWGGSEELWSGTALLLARAGHTVRAFKTNVNANHPRLVALRVAGCPITDLTPAVTLRKRITNRLLPYRRQYTWRKISQQLLTRGLRALEPQLTVISQGSNYDGFVLADVCRSMGLPYVLLSQKAIDFFLPPDLERGLVQEIYRLAQRCYFVSRHNLELTELQLGMRLPEAEVVWNPYNVPFAGELAWPAPTATEVVQLACVARLHVPDKGQDLLLQVLAQPKWRQRAVHVTLFGDGPDEAAIQEMIAFLNLQDKVSFGGHTSDVAGIWRSHHALILPSRHEGLPLALVEAMLSGRPTIAANAGGIAELLTDEVTGFLAAAATVPALDEALERAWAARAAWPQLGAEAARQARASVPIDAPRLLAQKLLNLVAVSAS